MVTVISKSEVDNRYKDLAYNTDDGSIMMVQKTVSKQTLNGITVIAVPGADGTEHGTTILIDNGFTGFAMMSHHFAESLGYEFQYGKGESYRTVAGTMEMNISVTIDNFEVAPQESGDFGYGVIMGIGMMDYLGIDQSRTDKMITWGHDIEVPMVPNGYWTETCIQTICQQPTKTERTKNSDSIAPIVSFAKDLFLTKQTKTSIKKAVYKTPDLLKVAERDGMKLTSTQQALLLSTLVKNEAVSGRNKTKTKCNSISRKTVPNPFEELGGRRARSRTAMLDRSCLRRLTPEGFEERKWAFPGFGVPKNQLSSNQRKPRSS
jgi:hypothetical protein